MPRPFSLPSSLGADLKALREQSGLGQKDIQRSSGLDQSRVSRLEKGDVSPTTADVNAYLSALPAPIAKRYKDYLRTEWRLTKQPAFLHPELETLVRAERCLQQIEGAFREEGESSPIRGQMRMYKAGLVRLVDFLATTDHVAALIGPVGVGKSTVISHATGLLMPSKDGGLVERCVLEVAGGRTTLCEVQVKPAQVLRMGIFVEPQTDDELHILVGDLCAGLMRDGATAEEQRRGVTTETETALRNMAGLARKSTVGSDKRRVTRDPLRELASKAQSRDELRAEVCTRMNLDRRVRCELWYEGPPGDELAWLKKTFSDVNRGRIEDVPLPRRIDVLLPRPALASPFDMSVVDTKGIDDAGTAIRPDLELRLTDPRTINILCSTFPDAPNAVAQQILGYLRDVGATEALRERVLLLVLPQHEQALEVMEDGAKVVSREHGYEVKERDAVEQLHRAQFSSPPPFVFYDAVVDDAKSVADAVGARVRGLRESYVAQIATIHDNVSLLLADKEQARAIAAQTHVLEQIGIFVERHEIAPRRSRLAHTELVRLMRQVVHPRTLWASTRRRGRYASFNVYFRLGSTVATDARERSRKFFLGLGELLAQWKADPELEGASGLLETLGSNIEFWLGRFTDSCRRAGEETFRPPLLDQGEESDRLWASTENLYGTGGGYRDAVAAAFDSWFGDDDREVLHDALDKRVREAWAAEVIEPLRRLCSPGAMPTNEASQ